jgi:hypothetical protein
MATQRSRGGVLYWFGDRIQRRFERAALRSIDATTEAVAEHARTNHRGWVSRTGTAEGSIATRPARLLKGRITGAVTGGEGDAFHLLILEVKKGAALRTAGDVHLPSLPERLVDEYAKGHD